MGQLQVDTELHGQRIHQARQLFFSRGEAPEGLLTGAVLRSWERCRQAGLESHLGRDCGAPAGLAALKEEAERNRLLLAHAVPMMEHVYEQIRHSGSMVILADMNGLLLQCVGDADFVDRAGKVALQPGASWDESLRGTNAIGTALVEARPVEVFGGEHFLERNGFLTCSATPLFDPQGCMVGILDISGDYRAYQRHTLGLVRMSAQIVEKRLFEAQHAREILVCFHPRVEYLGSLGEGMAAVSGDGRVLAVNQAGLDLLGLRRREAVGRDFCMLFETGLANLVERVRFDPHICCTAAAHNGKQYYVRLHGALPPPLRIGRIVADEPPQQRPLRGRLARGGDLAPLDLDTLGTGDPRLQAAIDKARRVLGRDIPILVQGESGAGKEMFAKAFHNSGPRRDGPFVALNCAAIPESLIESELFGYLGGAFTGARKEGAMGKIQQADGGTLFLDEIGDMPFALQARLLRVLQERRVTPLGSSKTIAVDISLVCATHRRLKEEVARGNFREDLYYRLNGLCLIVPPLRERTDLCKLARNLIRVEAGEGREITVSEAAMRAFERYRWPGNIRELHNVIRVAIALLDSGEDVIGESHLPEEMFEDAARPASAAAAPGQAIEAAAAGDGASLDEIEQQAIQRALHAADGNISAAARSLGISRNTLYRKLGRL